MKNKDTMAVKPEESKDLTQRFKAYWGRTIVNKIAVIIGVVLIVVVLLAMLRPQFAMRSMHSKMSSGSDYSSSHSFAEKEYEKVGYALVDEDNSASGKKVYLSMVEQQDGQKKYTQKIIKSCSVSLEVVEYYSASKEVEKIVNEEGGYIENSSVSKDQDEKQSGSLKLRLPSKNFESALTKLEKIGRIVGKTINGENVTEEYYDTEARLRNAEATEKRLLSFLDKAKDAKEAVAVQQELDNVSERIERFKGRMKYINHAVGYSTIELSLGEQGSIMTSRNVIWNNVKNQFKETISSCVDAFVVALKGSFVFISFAIPIILMCLLVALIYKWVRRIFPPKKIKN